MSFISENLEREIRNRIELLSNEEKYINNFLNSIDSTSSSSIDDSNQRGTATPHYMGAANTFVANPSNVGIGVLARMIETDATVLSSVQFKSLMMLSKIGEYQHDNDEIAEFVRDFVKNMKNPTWTESLEGQSSNGAYGFSVSEIIWGINKKMQKVPLRIPTYHPSTIAFEVDQFGNVCDDGVIQFVIQYAQNANPNYYYQRYQNGFTVANPFTTPEDRLLPTRVPFISNYGLLRIPRKKVVHHVSNSMLSFGSPYGKTSVRSAHLAWQLKVFFMKQMGVAGKRQASPFVWATAPQNANQVQYDVNGITKQVNPREALRDILANRETDDSVVTGPESAGYKITAIAQQMDLNQFLAVLNWLDTQIFRAFLLPSLVMTDGSAGSRALGDKHFQVVDWIAGEEAKKFCDTIINSVIKQAIEYNFGEQDDYGHFTQRPQSIEERERLANIFSTLGNSGFMKSYDEKDGEFVRSSLHLPKQEKSFYTEPMPNFDPIDLPDDVETINPTERSNDDASDEPKTELETKSDSAFNGAQVTAVVNVVTSVSTGQIPLQTGKEILKSMFGFTDEQATRLLHDDIIKEVNEKEKEASDKDDAKE
jgi:hypothetical protein